MRLDYRATVKQNVAMNLGENNSSGNAGSDQFQTTCWSVVMAARNTEPLSDDWRTSLETLCQAYWYPLYAYLRRKGYSVTDCQDLTQDFFARLIEKDFLQAIDPERGRFRWFMMDAIKKFAANWNAARNAQKRGGGRKMFSLEFEDGESRYQQEPTDGMTAERLFERRWTLELLDRAMQELETRYQQAGKLRHFQSLKVFLTADSSPPSYAEVAENLGISVTAIKVAIHRLRDKFRDCVHRQVADTLDEEASLEDEFTRLLETL